MKRASGDGAPSLIVRSSLIVSFARLWTAAIAGAFGAPLAGAFYAFELVLGGYSPISLTPVAVAALVGYAVAHKLAFVPLGVIVSRIGEVHAQDLLISSVLGLCAALWGATSLAAALFP